MSRPARSIAPKPNAGLAGSVEEPAPPEGTTGRCAVWAGVLVHFQISSEVLGRSTICLSGLNWAQFKPRQDPPRPKGLELSKILCT
jgi:hypothetical protein